MASLQDDPHFSGGKTKTGFSRLELILLVVLVLAVQYRLWWGEGGRLELGRLQQQAQDARRENARLKARNAELTRQVLDLKSGQVVLEQRAREELGLIADDEVFYHFPAAEETRRPQAEPAQP